MEALSIARTVFVFPNGIIAACDSNGQQIPELQGPDSPALRFRIRRRSDERTEWLDRSRVATGATRAVLVCAWD